MVNLAGGVARAFLTLLSLPLLISNLGQDTFGLWMLISAIIGVAMLAEAGLSTSTTYFAARDIAADDSVGLGETLTATFAAVAVLATVTAIVLLLGSRWLVSVFDKLDGAQREAASSALRIGILAVVALLLQHVLLGLVRGFQRFDISNLVSTLQVAANVGGYIIISARGGGVVTMMTWHVLVSVAGLVAYAVAAAYLLRGRNVRARWQWSTMVSIWRYSSMTWAGTLGGVLFSQMDRLVVGKIMGTSSLAVYAAITSTVKQINSFSAMPVQPLLPRLSELATQLGRSEAIRRQVRAALQVNAFLALGMGIGLFTLAPVVLEILLARPATQIDVAAMRVACVIYALFSLNGTGYYVLLGMNGVRAFMIIQLCSGFLALVLVALGARQGLLGAIWGNAGYLGVWAFSVLGMRLASVPLSTWGGWIGPALIVFGVGVLVAVLLPPTLPASVLWMFALAQCVILTFWFARQQPSLLRSILNPVLRR